MVSFPKLETFWNGVDQPFIKHNIGYVSTRGKLHYMSYKHSTKRKNREENRGFQSTITYLDSIELRDLMDHRDPMLEEESNL